MFNKKKVAIFLPSLAGGGAERALLNLAKGMLSKGIAVDLILGKVEGPYLEEVPRELKLIDLDASRALFCIKGLVRYLKGEKPLSLLTGMSYVNVLGLWAKRLARVSTSVVVTEHCPLSNYLSNTSLFRDSFLPYLIKKSYPSAKKVVCASKGIADDLISTVGVSAGSVEVINNPFFVDDILRKSHEEIFHPWFENRHVPLIMGAGRLSKEKDFKNLILAFSQVREKINCKLVILGEGEERTKLSELIKKLNVEDSVVLMGFVKNIYAYLSKASVFVLSSSWEGFGNVIVEALACGTPVVSTDCPGGGPAEILKNGEFGPLVPTGNPNLLAKAILKVINEPLNSFVLIGRANDFSINYILEKYLKVVNS